MYLPRLLTVRLRLRKGFSAARLNYPGNLDWELGACAIGFSGDREPGGTGSGVFSAEDQW